jgi:TP901 family phage tail tape measure protein
LAGAESFTVLAILEARDAASEVFAKIDESLGKFSDSAKEAADTAKAAGDSIDDSLLKTASGADALDVADARVAAASARVSAAMREQAVAEQALLDVQKDAAAAGDEDAATQERLILVNQNLTAASRESAAATKALSDTQKLQSDTAVAAAAKNDEAAAGTAAVSDASKAGGISLASMGKVAGITALGLGVVGAVAVKAAGNFQSLTQHLVTDAGESQKNLAMVRAGILSISTATGTSATDITNAMYHIESAGMHGAEGLDVAKVAAEGAKVGGADLDTVSKTLVGTLTAYYGGSMNASNATQRSTSMMEQLIATTGSGDMRLQDLASSLSTVAPLAAKAGISFAQVGGAIATMTSQGMSARQATVDLAHTITSLENPTTVQTNEMAQLGLSSQKVASQLGSKGLTGTIGTLTQAITSHMGKSGTVIMNAFNQSTSAAQDAQLMLSKLPPSIQGVAKAYLAGSTSYQTFNTATKGVGLQARTLADQFATTAGKAKGFNSLLTSGQPGVQTYTAALAKMTGGQTGLKTALMLTGENAGVFAKNVASISRQGKGAAVMTESWAQIQGTFNQKVDVAKTAVENTGIAIGSALLPAVTGLFSAISKVLVPVAEWTAKHQKLTEYLFAGVTALAATVAMVSLAAKTFRAVKSAVNDVGSAVKGAIGLLQKMGILSKKTSDDQAADAKKAAAAQEQASGESAAAAEKSAGEQETASAEAAAAGETDAAETAAANETAAAESSGSWVTAAGQQVAAAARWVAQQAAQVAGVIAKNVAGAATTLASWVATGAGMVAQGAVWVAQTAVKVAAVVASNVAGALVTAAAWVAANAVMLLGIGLIVAAVVIAVLLIVKYWKQISAAAAVVWHDVTSAAETAGRDIAAAVQKVIGWVKSNWPLLLAILLGPVAVAALEIGKHWTQIKDGAAGVIDDVTRFFKSLPGRITSALGDVGRLLWNAGASIIHGLVSGIESAIGDVESTVSGVASTIKSFLPFSPAKQGPLSGSGDPSNSGKSIASKLAQGMLASKGVVSSAAGQLAASVALGKGGSLTAGIGSTLALSAAGSAGAGGSGSINLTLDLRGAVVTSPAAMNALASQVGKAVVKQLAPAGYKIRTV